MFSKLFQALCDYPITGRVHLRLDQPVLLAKWPRHRISDLATDCCPAGLGQTSLVQRKLAELKTRNVQCWSFYDVKMKINDIIHCIYRINITVPRMFGLAL